MFPQEVLYEKVHIISTHHSPKLERNNLDPLSMEEWINEPFYPYIGILLAVKGMVCWNMQKHEKKTQHYAQ